MSGWNCRWCCWCSFFSCYWDRCRRNRRNRLRCRKNICCRKAICCRKNFSRGDWGRFQCRCCKNCSEICCRCWGFWKRCFESLISRACSYCSRFYSRGCSRFCSGGCRRSCCRREKCGCRCRRTVRVVPITDGLTSLFWVFDKKRVTVTKMLLVDTVIYTAGIKTLTGNENVTCTLKLF